MKLSEAIRLGAMIRPQVIGGYVEHGTCALGAAADASGIPAAFDTIQNRPCIDYTALADRFPVLHAMVDHPAATLVTDCVESIIWELNDVCHWTREAIADWVATIEPQETPAATPEQHAEVSA